MTTLFISDLHLSPERPAIVAQFLRFLHHRAPHSDGLYILGDLFEYWIGDEAVAEAPLAPVIAGLREVTAQGVPVRVMVGNRDFLMGPGFAAATGSELLDDPHLLTLGAERAILMHGDTLCTDDTDYQAFRAQIRRPDWIGAFLAKSIPERLAMAREYREMSRVATGHKAPQIMDVNDEAVRQCFRDQGVSLLIHGHTHRPGMHTLTVDGQTVRRVVLGDWYTQGSVLAHDTDQGLRFDSTQDFAA